MSKNLLYLKDVQEAPKAVRSKMDTILITPEVIASWKLPPCQAPLKVNAKVRACAEELRLNGNVVSGVITLGTIKGCMTAIYLLDGQHRCEGVKISGIKEAIGDVRICDYDSMADMGVDWVKMNSYLVRKTPDDILHALEPTLPSLQYIRKHCDFVGYSNIRRSETSAMLSMSVAIRCWVGSKPESGAAGANQSVIETAKSFTDKLEVEHLANFLLIARDAWGRDYEYRRLWGQLNLTICMWLFRRIVLGEIQSSQHRHATITREQFKKCLMSLSANSHFLDWLVGRNLGERDRGPCYTRIKAVFVRRMQEETGKSIKLPSPSWASK